MLGKWYQTVWNDNNSAAIDQLMNAEVVIVDLFPPAVYFGTDHLKSVAKMLREKFSEIKFTVKEGQEYKDAEIAECTLEANFKGKRIKVDFTSMIRMKNGKITMISNDADILLLEKAGELIPV